MPNFGTRSRAGVSNNHTPESAPNGQLTRDAGMKKNITASVTFSTSPARATAAAGTFVNFASNDIVVVNGTSINDGFYAVLGTDGSTYLTLDPPPKSAGPVTATIRTP